eukprot:SAG22_NODE_409_length_10939_cov_1.956638_4_plen_131_part_00
MGLLAGLKGGGLTASARFHMSFYARTTAVESGCLLAVSIAARNASHGSSSEDIFSSFPIDPIEKENSTIALTTTFEQHSVTFTAPPLPWQELVRILPFGRCHADSRPPAAVGAAAEKRRPASTSDIIVQS